MAMLAVPAVGTVPQTLGKSSAQPQRWAQLHTQALLQVVDCGEGYCDDGEVDL